MNTKRKKGYFCCYRWKVLTALVLVGIQISTPKSSCTYSSADSNGDRTLSLSNCGIVVSALTILPRHTHVTHLTATLPTPQWEPTWHLERRRYQRRKSFPFITSVHSSSQGQGDDTRPTLTVPSFSDFQFASNGVCIQPAYFHTADMMFSYKNGPTAEKQTSNSHGCIDEIESIHQREKQRDGEDNYRKDDNDNEDDNADNISQPPTCFTMRNVPGEGDCMFLAVALAAATSMGLGGNDALLRAISRETREVVAQVLENDGTLYISSSNSSGGSGKGRKRNSSSSMNTCRTQDLLLQATRQEGFNSTDEYLAALRTEGSQGGLYGGGPELTVLANILRRPISIYELQPQPISRRQQSSQQRSLIQSASDQERITNSDQNPSATSVQTKSSTNKTPAVDSSAYCPIICRGTFGDGLFEDPCLLLSPTSAVLSTSKATGVIEPPEKVSAPLGAFSWHLHILVVDVSPREKHACVLLPVRTET